MWLMHPTLSTLVLGTAKAIIDEVYRHVADKDFDLEYMFPRKFRGGSIWSDGFEQWGEIPLVADIGCTLSSKAMIDYLHKSDANKISPKFLKVWRDRMRGLSTYKMYSTYIEGLYDVLVNSVKTFHNCNKSIQRNWLEGAKFLS
jgi:hypothetical protein